MMKAVDERVTWPVVLVAHAYAGAITAATRDEKVKALACVAALAPDEGETVADDFWRAKPYPQAPITGSSICPRKPSLQPSPKASIAARAVPDGSAATLACVHHGRGGSIAMQGASDRLVATQNT
jgi:hypothetical protein